MGSGRFGSLAGQTVALVEVKGHRRLVWLRKDGGGSGIWDHVWRSVDLVRLLDWQKSVRIIQGVFENYLPRDGKILEAGCGLGQWVMILRDRGYDIEGIDASTLSIERAIAFRSELPVRVGDVRCLDYPDGHFVAYISLGVVEHFLEGPEGVLLEARRVLVPGGVLICSVPYFNPVRALRRREILDYSAIFPADFYQWAFSKSEFLAQIEGLGFGVLKWVPCETLKTLRDEFRTFRTLVGSISEKCTAPENDLAWGNPGASLATRIRRVAKNYLLESIPMRRLFGHMMICVARKK